MIVPGPELLNQLNNCDDDIQFRKLDENREEDVAIAEKRKSPPEANNRGFLCLCCCISIGTNLLLGIFCIICQLPKNIVFNYSNVTSTSIFFLALVLLFAAWFVSSDVVTNTSKRKEHSGTTKNKETVQRLRNKIIAALGSIHAPFVLLDYSMVMMMREDHEMNSIPIEPCWRLVHAFVPLVAQIDSSLQFLHVATGIQLGIGPTSLSVSRIEELHMMNRPKHSATTRLKENLFQIMIQMMQSLDDMQTLLQQTTARHPPETTIIHENSAVPNLLELYQYATKEKLPSFVVTLSLLKSCKVQLVSSLSRCAALLFESNAITCSQSSLLNKKVQLSIQIANDGTEYLKQALFPFSTHNKNDNNRIVDNNKDIMCRLLVKLDAARTSLWCIQENASLETEAKTDEENSMYRTFLNDDVAWWTQCCNCLEESLRLSRNLLEKSLSAAQPDIQVVTQDNPARRPNENVDIAAKPKTELFVDTGGPIQQPELDALSPEGHRSSSIVKNECTTVIYSGKGKCCSNNPISVGSPRKRSGGSLDAVSFPPDVFMDELQIRLGTMEFPEELPLLRDNFFEGDDTPTLLPETNNYKADPLEDEDKSSLLVELVELQKLMVQNYDR